MAESRAWIDFVMFTAIPVGVREIVNWLYRWQALVAAIVVLLAAYILGRAVLKAARIHAKVAPIQSTREIETTQSAASATLGAGRAKSIVETSLNPGAGAFRERLTVLRGQIRATLSRLPCTDEPLSVENGRLCGQIAKFLQVEAIPDKVLELQGGLEALRIALTKLGSATTNQNAWAALVQTNEAARDLVQMEGRSDEANVDWESFKRLRRNRLEG